MVRQPGTPPGTLTHTGEQKVEEVSISLFDYDENGFQERTVEKIEDCFPFKDSPTVTWININGLHVVENVEKIGKHFNIHPLVLEDILHTDQRPKMEDLDEYIYIVARMLSLPVGGHEVGSEQLSIVLGENVVITFQERPGDMFDPIRDRIRKGKGRVRKSGADYLAYLLLDTIVDSCFMILEQFGDIIEGLEEDLFAHPTVESLHAIHHLKRESLALKRAVWPLREVISGLQRAETPLVRDSTGMYLKDVYDHTIQVIDTIESQRDMVSGLQDLYLSTISNRMNEVMKVLTIIATIFIPLTFVAGIYGMNFENMPELGWEYGYFAALTVMAILGAIMVYFFRRNHWL